MSEENLGNLDDEFQTGKLDDNLGNGAIAMQGMTPNAEQWKDFVEARGIEHQKEMELLEERLKDERKFNEQKLKEEREHNAATQ